MTTPTEPPFGGDQPGGVPPGSPPPGYGQPPPGYPPPPPGYGSPYGAAPMGGAMPGLANWGQRVGGAAIDYIVPGVIAGIIFQISTGLGIVLDLVALAWALYNAYLGGQTGQSYGKKALNIRLVSEQTGQPIGGGLGIGRYFVHILDSLACYLGWLWPLWDDKNQTFADKLIHTVVVQA